MNDQFLGLSTFVAVVEAGGLSAASGRLGTAKSAISRRLRELEARLGTTLFSRTGRRLRLTETGEDFYRRVTRLLEDLRDAEAVASRGSREAVGRLRVSAPVSFTIHCLAPVVREFAERHPRLQVEIETDDRIVDIIGDGYDLAVRISELKDSTLVARRLAQVRHVLCASPGYLAVHGRPERPEDLAGHVGITYGYRGPRRHWTFKDGYVAAIRSNLWMTNGDAMREAAVSGAGIVLLPTFIVHRAVERGELEVLLAEHMRPPIALYAVFPSRKRMTARARLFVDFLADRFAGEPFWDRAMPPGPDWR